MTNAERLKIYDQLREAHRYITVLDTAHMEEIDRVAIDTVSGVLYLAEGHFAQMDE
jgi:hypothetical protein